jgi:hypothetical protein
MRSRSTSLRSTVVWASSPASATLTDRWIGTYRARLKTSGSGWSNCDRDNSQFLTVGHSAYRQVTEQHRRWGFQIESPY